MLVVKKRIPLEALQWNRFGDHPRVFKPTEEEVAAFLEGTPEGCGVIRTLEGNLIVRPGSWVLGPGTAGEYWAVQDDIFRDTYEQLLS